MRLVPGQDASERFVLCRSGARADKERAMLERQLERLRTELQKIDASLRAAPQSDRGKVGRRIGRWLGHYPAAAAVLTVTLQDNDAGHAGALTFTERADKLAWARLAHGAYLLRTNHPSEDPAQLWRWYLQLTQAEAAFRTGKSDLHLRPVFHQLTGRIEAHILVSFLALA